jgi:hypothetical protein
MSTVVVLSIGMLCDEGETDTLVDRAMPNLAHETAISNAVARIAK